MKTMGIDTNRIKV